MTKHYFLIVTVIAGLALAPRPALAQQGQIGLQGDVRLEKTVTENGATKKVLTDTKVVVPGDRLLFSTAFVNNGTAAVEQFVVTNPLPSAVALAPESAGSMDVSVDGGKTYGPLAGLKVPDGNGGQRAAEAADVTHVRWIIPTIAPRAQGKVEFYAIVR
ncbi:MAG: hypothetical protein RIQ46_1159 [Pseudomonadota bacterium]|jgi:uncharacterized repeat protein (TIGR01451 family)